jgi:hypothetical protein
MKILDQFVAPAFAFAILTSPGLAEAANGRLLLGTDGGIYPQVKVFDDLAQAEVSQLFPYASSYQGGVRVATGDVNGDGSPDIIAGSGAAFSHVKVFSGRDGSALFSFEPYGVSYAGGIFVAAGDVNGDGLDDIITGANVVGGHVKVFDGKTGAELHSFFAFSPNFTGGVRVAAGDVDGDGRADIIAGSGVGGAQVKVFSGKSHEEIRSFVPYDTRFSGGVFVAAGDVDGDGLADIITGADAGAGPHVKVFNGRSGAEFKSFSPFLATFSGGVRVAAGDLDGDGRADIIASGGPGGGTVKAFSGKTGDEMGELAPYGAQYAGGVFVAAGDIDGDRLADVITGAGAGAPGGHVRVFDGRTGSELNAFDAFPASFTGGVRVAAGDLDGDGVTDIITGTGAGATHVKAFSGRDGSVLHSFFPYGDSFSGGVFVGSGDINGDGLDDIVTGADSGVGPHVKVFSGQTGAELQSFFAFPPTFTGGVRVAAGDVDGDGRADIIVGSGAGAGHVKVFSGKSGAEIRSFAPYDPQFSGGVFVGGGDVNGDGFADIITGAGAGTGGHVKVFDGRSGSELHSFFAFPGFLGGVRVAAGDLDGDGRRELIVAPGPGISAHVRVLDGTTLTETAKFLAFAESYTNGIYVAAASVRRLVLESRFEPKTREIILRWPAGSDCRLEASRDLADTRGWKPVEVRPVQIGNRLEAVFPATLEGEFFRLSCPE